MFDHLTISVSNLPKLKAHILFTDMIHIVSGFGIGLILADERFMVTGVIALSIGIAGHIFAFLKA